MRVCVGVREGMLRIHQGVADLSLHVATCSCVYLCTLQ